MRKSVVGKHRDRPPPPRTSGRMFSRSGRALFASPSQLKLLRQRLSLMEAAVQALERLQYILTNGLRDAVSPRRRTTWSLFAKHLPPCSPRGV